VLGATCSGDDNSSEQGEVAGLSAFMAKALKVVSAPEAFLQKEQGPRHIALPCFSFNKRGALVKTMSRKHSSVSQQSATDVVLQSARGLRVSDSLASQRTQSGLTASSHGQTLSRQQSSQQDVSTQHVSQHQGAMQPRSQATVPLLPEAALASIPEEEPAPMQKVKKVVKTKRRRKMKRGSRVTQPGGMTDQEKSIWLLEHCKVLMSS
jgi:apolipoprotein N-acyltransferase